MDSPGETKAVRQKLNISRLAIRYPRITIGFWIAVVVAGLFAFGSLKYALFPDITFPVVVVNAQAAAASSALDTESQLTLPLEAKLRGLPALDDISSTTTPDRVTLRVSFQVGRNLETATRETEAAIRSVRLPENTVVDTIPLNLNESAAVTYVVQSPSRTLDQLASLARTGIMPGIRAVDGVLKVRMIGTLQEALPTAAAAADSAASADTAPSPELVRFNGQRALALEVVKKSSANTLDLVHRVDAVIGEIRRSLPGIEIVQASTQANYIEEASHATLEAIAIAVALSVIVIYPFLWNWKATLISALAIPTSLFGTFIVMAICRFSLETITLLAIALVVGIIVDDAIVDVENISRHLDLGEPPHEAAIAATDEVSLTVTAATLTIAAVFIPVGLMGGVVGQFFRPFGLTVSAAVLISLLVARTLSPLLSMYWLRASPSRPEGQSRFSFLGGYTGLLKWALRHRVLVVALTLSSLLLGIGLVSVVNKGFIPRLDRGEFLIHFTAATTAPSSPEANAIDQPRDQPLSMAQIMAVQLLQTQKQAERIEERVRREPEVKDILMTVGNQWGQADRGELLIRLQPGRQRSTLEHQTEIRNRLAGLRGLDVRVEDIPFVETGSEQPIQIKLLGSDLPTLDRAAIALKHRLSTLPGLVDISTSAPPSGDPENLVIEHLNGRRIRYVRANLLPGTSVDHAVSRISKATAGMLPGGVTIDFGGDSERIREILSSFLFTITLGIVCILGVLVFLYRTWSDPLIIMFSLPLSFCGAMLALLLTRQEFGMISVIGIIFLMGLTNKNAIIMVDYVNQLRSSGLEPTQAILTGATVRLRPILMTTAATILGMLPVALGLGAGSELRAPMAIAILGGLVASTLLSLFVIPVMVSLLEGFKRKISIAFTPSR